MDKLRVGVVGVGHMGLYHANVLSSLNGKINFIGVSDTDENRAKEVGNKYNIPYYTDSEELLKRADAVTIASPTFTHYDEVKKAFEHNVHVLVEKPMTTSTEQARKLVNTAKKKSLVFQVGHIERFRGIVRETKSFIKKPYLIEVKRMQGASKRISDVGVTLDLMIHDIDIIHLLLGADVDNIFAHGKSVYTDYDDMSKVVLLFDNGCIADLTASRISQYKIRRLDIYQEKSDIFLNFLKDEISVHTKSHIGYEVEKGEIKYVDKSNIENTYVHTENPLKNEIIHFLKVISGKEKAIIKPEWDIKTLDVTLEIVNTINKHLKHT